MAPITRFAVAVVLAAVAAPAVRAADITDPADLFPPDTLAYAEVHDPAAVAPQLAAVFKGTVLEDSIRFIQTRRDAAKDPRDLTGKDQLALLGLFASPEMAAEFKKFRGVAVGMTGWVSGASAQGEPEIALAILTGDSQAAGLAMRAFLTMTSVRKVGAVGDVPVYQFRQPSIGYEPNGRPMLQNEKVTEGPHEPTFAYLPGLIVVGTGKAPVGAVVTRFRGKAKGALSGTPAFKQAAAAHRRPGVFFFANAPEFCAKYDEVRRKSGDGVEPDALGWFRLVANAKAVRYVAGSATFRDGGLAVTVAGAFDPGQKSPLLDLLSGSGASAELLRNAPTPATFAFAVTLPEKDRAAAVVGFLDAMAKATGQLGRLPGEAVKELERKYQIPLAAELIGKTRAVTVVLPVRQELPKGARALPMLVLQTEGPDVAAGWEDFLPKLVGDLTKSDPPQPTTEMLGEVKVFSLAGTGLPWNAAVHYARKGGVFAVGLDRKLVAAAAGDAGGNGVTVPPGDPPALLGTVGPGGLARLLTETTRPQGPVVPLGPVGPATTVPGFRGGFEDFSGPAGGPAGASPDQKKDEAKGWDDLLKALDGLPATTVTARRSGNELRFDLWQPKVQGGGLAPVVNAGVGWFDKLLNRNPNPNGPYSPGYGGRFRW